MAEVAQAEKRLSKRRRQSGKRKSLAGRRRVLSDLGASMYNLGDADPNHDTVINSVLYFETPVDLDRLKERVVETMSSHWRFKSTVHVNRDGAVEWKVPKEDSGFDIDQHVRNISIPCSSDTASQEELNEYIGSLYGQLMDYSVPVWEVLNLDNVENVGPDGSCNAVVIVRLHHVIGDGISLTAFLAKLFDPREDDDDSAASSVTAGGIKSTKKKLNIWPKVAPWMRQLHGARVFAQGVLEGLLLPVLPGDEICALHSPDNTKLGPRLVANSPEVDLDMIKEIKEAIGATVNDVLVAALAGVMRKYLESHSHSVPQGQVRAACLINMRSKEEMTDILNGKGDLGNKFNFLPLHVPLSKKDPLDRLYHCKTGLDDIKMSPAPLLAFKVNTLAARFLPKGAVVQATRDLFQKMTCVFSNVPGPQHKVSVCGSQVRGMNFFANSLTATVFGLISYNNKVQLTVVADTNVVPDPQQLVNLFKEEIHELHHVTRGKFRKPVINAINYGIDAAVLLAILLIFVFLPLKFVLL